jgi:MoaA/NifB/PqqE/SkfB family radical SAM enzyme
MQSHKGRFEPTRFGDLTVTVDFHCHSACRFCIVQEGMNRYRGLPLARFREVVADNQRLPKHRRVVFTGGEVTLEPALFDFIRIAKESGSFEHIRVQTNGRRLSDRGLAQRFVDAGVDEWFVSLHGHDAATQDHISQRPGSFDEAMAGIRNLAELGVTLMTNTVLTTLNLAHLADIVRTVAPYRPVRMEFWNYLPMEDFADTQGLLAPLEVLAPALRTALDAARSLGIETAEK